MRQYLQKYAENVGQYHWRANQHCIMGALA